jgi:hypothetical protein
VIAANPGVELLVFAWSPWGGTELLASTQILGSSTAVVFTLYGGDADRPTYVAFAFAASPDSVLPRQEEMTSVSMSFEFVPQGRFCCLPAPNMWTALPTLQGVRSLGRSALFRNTSSALNAAGEVAGLQMPLGAHWLTMVTQSPTGGNFPAADSTYGFSAVSSQRQSCNMLAKNGFYMWSKPNSKDWDSWRLEHRTAYNTVSATASPLQDICYQIMAANIPLSISTIQTGTWEIAYSFEVQTSDTTREQLVPVGTSISMLRLQDAVRSMQQYSENPLHWDVIWANIKKAVGIAANAVVKYGPSVIRGAQLAASLL